jgi:hypothetical protein
LEIEHDSVNRAFSRGPPARRICSCVGLQPELGAYAIWFDCNDSLDHSFASFFWCGLKKLIQKACMQFESEQLFVNRCSDFLMETFRHLKKVDFMPVISVPQFIGLTDRLAADYQLFDDAINKRNLFSLNHSYASAAFGAVYPARLFLDLTGSGSHLLLSVTTPGVSGNNHTFSLIQPTGVNANLTSSTIGSDYVVNLQTDNSGHLLSTVEDLVSFLRTNSDFSDLTITYPVTDTVGLVQPLGRTPFSGGSGSGSASLALFTIASLLLGDGGNGYTVTIVNPGTANRSLSFSLTGLNLTIYLATDGSSTLTTTISQLKTAMSQDCCTRDRFQVIGFSNGSTLVPVASQTLLKGAGHVSYTQIALTPPPNSNTGAADPDVAFLASSASDADSKVTTALAVKGLVVLENLQGALVNHFARLNYTGGEPLYLDSNDIRVHRNFSLLQQGRTGQTLPAIHVFRPDVIVLATFRNTGSWVYLAGTDLGSGSGLAGDTPAPNYAAAKLIATLQPAGGSLAVSISLVIKLIDTSGNLVNSSPINFSSGSLAGSMVNVSVVSSNNYFFAVSGLLSSTGGSSGDQIVISQIIERQINL